MATLTPAQRHAAYLRQQLHLVQSGRKTRAPGIRKCPDCHKPYIGDDTPVVWCPECRTGHQVACRDCGTRFPCDQAGTVICPCCRDQTTLF